MVIGYDKVTRFNAFIASLENAVLESENKTDTIKLWEE